MRNLVSPVACQPEESWAYEDQREMWNVVQVLLKLMRRGGWAISAAAWRRNCVTKVIGDQRGQQFFVEHLDASGLDAFGVQHHFEVADIDLDVATVPIRHTLARHRCSRCETLAG